MKLKSLKEKHFWYITRPFFKVFGVDEIHPVRAQDGTLYFHIPYLYTGDNHRWSKIDVISFRFMEFGGDVYLTKVGFEVGRYYHEDEKRLKEITLMPNVKEPVKVTESDLINLLQKVQEIMHKNDLHIRV